MDWNTFTNFDAALPMPEQITTALGGKGRYRGRFYVCAQDKPLALDVLRSAGVLARPHVRVLQPVPRGQLARVRGLESAGLLQETGEVALVVTHEPDGSRIGWPPVFRLGGEGEDRCWIWQGRIRNGGRWEPLGPEDTRHLARK